MYFHLSDVLAATFLLSIWLPLLNISLHFFFVYSHFLRTAEEEEGEIIFKGIYVVRNIRTKARPFLHCCSSALFHISQYPSNGDESA